MGAFFLMKRNNETKGEPSDTLETDLVKLFRSFIKILSYVRGVKDRDNKLTTKACL